MKRGDRVKASKHAFLMGVLPKRGDADCKGTVINQRKDIVSVVWDGHKTAQYWHETYLERVYG